MRLVLASTNPGKKREIREILDEMSFPLPLHTMQEEGFDFEIEETGHTFGENAFCKANAVHDALEKEGRGDDVIVLADDSGLVIDALNGEPGVYSARYLGEHTPHAEKNAVILSRLENVPEEARTARFVCAVCAVMPDGTHLTVTETMEGRIAREARGEGGFGYDPVFLMDGSTKTNAELTAAEKNAHSHRGKAFRAIVNALFENNIL